MVAGEAHDALRGVCAGQFMAAHMPTIKVKIVISMSAPEHGSN